jgi:hypothetical protein
MQVPITDRAIQREMLWRVVLSAEFGGVTS